MTAPEPVRTVGAERAREDELVRLLASTTSVRAERVDEILELWRDVSPGALWRAMHRHGAVPLLGARLLELADVQVTGELRRRIDRALEHAHKRGATLETITVHLVARLEDAGIRCLPLKGATLAARLMGDSGLRQVHDIDLLVHPHELAAAEEVLRAQGYCSAGDADWGNGLPLLHRTFVGEGAWRPIVELHWRIHWTETGFSQRLLDRSVADERFGRVPALDDDLAALLAFYARDSYRGLKLAADIAAWSDRYDADAPDGLLDDILRDYPGLSPSLLIGLELAEGLVGAPVARLSSAPRSLGRAARTARSIADWRAILDGTQREAEITLIELLLTPPGGGGGWLRRNVFQPSSHIARQRSLVGRSKRELVLRSAAHGVAVGARFGPRFVYAVRRGAPWVDVA
jgi:hypothetical protein